MVIAAGIFIIIVCVFYNTFVILGEFSCLISVLIKRYLLPISYLYITRIFLFFSFGILLNLPPPYFFSYLCFLPIIIFFSFLHF